MKSKPGTFRGINRLAGTLALPCPLLPGFFAVLVFAGCLSSRSVTPVQLYTLDPKIETKQFDATELTVGVRPLHAARPYGRPMVTSDDGLKLEVQDFSAWAEDPRAYLTRALIDALSATHRFEDAGDASDMSRPDLLLTGELRKFRENRGASPAVAEIEVRLVLREAREKKSVWDEILTARMPLKGDTPAALAEAMDIAVAGIATRAAEAIAEAVPE
ncbi:MAG: membrane integrity-associated transporter subunit PqiC [Candidatus Hydrogenedentes bacterium]|nr:membrane integrity-associated transporter subunit PqiC [Candidatus Hydrogenedentota bacterium]